MDNLANVLVSFRLNNGGKVLDESKPSSIYIRIKRGHEVDFTRSLKIKVLSKYWDHQNMKIRQRAVFANKEEIQNHLDDLTTYIHDQAIEYRRKRKTLTLKVVKKIYDSFAEKEKETDPIKLFDFIDQFIEESKTRPNYKTGKPLSKDTIKGYTRTKNTLKNFEKSFYKIDFDSIGLEFYYDFLKWCEDQGFAKNYIGNHIKMIKIFMRAAMEAKATDNEAFKGKKFVVPSEEAENIYLNSEELGRIWNVDLSHDKRMDRARDLFLIGAYTGLRVSDYNDLSKQNIKEINGVRMLNVATKKTDKKVSIPLHPVIESILLKYNGDTPPRMPDQKINVYIKQVGEMVGLDEIESQTQTVGGKKVTKNKPKYTLIKTHTARRSFCTNAYLAKIPTIDIMAISGHTTEKSFIKYIKVTDEERAVKMGGHSFFKDSSALKKA